MITRENGCSPPNYEEYQIGRENLELNLKVPQPSTKVHGFSIKIRAILQYDISKAVE